MPAPLPDGGREWLDAECERVLVRGRWSKADVWLARLPDGRRGVVKEFRGKPWPGRWWGRLQIAREARFLAFLSDLRVAPRLIARPHPLVLVMEALSGRPLYHCEGTPEGRAALEPLVQAVRRVHGAGVVHLDLRGRENVQLERDGRVVLVDWASAVRLPPGTVRHRLFFGPLSRIDESALVKWRQKLAPDTLTAEDRRLLRSFRFWRRLWPVKRRAGRRRG
ncbi:MAG: hypothetical protein D6718_08390 [Acidobacteria bacterium]|nr:MAG: hypothetical protein D6718_08390 [Acidobacteriota bacterium]